MIHTGDMVLKFFHSRDFLTPFLLSLVVLGIFFTWELGYIPVLPQIPRVEPSAGDHFFTAILIFLMSFDLGLFAWRRHHGSCPVGTRRATGIAGAAGTLALLCPVCLLLPASIFGVSISLAFLANYIPLLKIIAIIILAVNSALLWPKK